MNPLDNPHSKESCLARATSQAKKEKLARKKGQDAEKKALAELCKQIGREPGPGDRVNNQRREGGGLNICDITVKGLDGWHKESKAGKTFQFPAFWKQIDEEAGPDKIKILIFTTETGRKFIQYELENLFNVSQDVVLASGFDIV